MGIFNKTSELMKKYEIEKGSLGSGNFAVVKKCWAKGTAKEGPYYAVKIIDKSKVEDMGDIEREIEIMGMVQHPNVIKLVEIFDEPKKMNLVMELVTGGELFDRIVSLGNYTEKDAAVVMSTLCNALDYLHAKGIVHRDLKPENILLENDSKDAAIKVADFGLARMISGKDMMKTACGTPGYVAPEVLQNKGYSSGAVDLWSAGVILYILLCGFPPFYEEELPALFDQILKGRCVRRAAATGCARRARSPTSVASHRPTRRRSSLAIRYGSGRALIRWPRPILQMAIRAALFDGLPVLLIFAQPLSSGTPLAGTTSRRLGGTTSRRRPRTSSGSC